MRRAFNAAQSRHDINTKEEGLLERSPFLRVISLIQLLTLVAMICYEDFSRRVVGRQ